MRYAIMRWPVWRRSVLIGLCFLVIHALIYGVVLGYGWVPTVTGGIVVTAVSVVGTALVISRAEKTLDPPAGPRLTADERVQAVRAVDRGEPGGSPRVQAAAVTLARQRVRQRIGVVVLGVLLGFFALVTAAFAIIENPRWWLIVGVIAVIGLLSAAELLRQHQGASKLLAMQASRSASNTRGAL